VIVRKRFQIHLSTAIVMMFAAGGLIWANAVPEATRSNGVLPSSYVQGMAYSNYEFRCYGWPWVAVVWTQERAGNIVTWQGADVFNRKELAADILVALAILVSLTTLCEWRIRRHLPKN